MVNNMFFVRIKDFEKDQAILQDDDGRLFIWPKKLLENDAKIGEKFEVEIKKINEDSYLNKTNTTESKTNNNNAKDILNEILKIQ